MNVRPKVLDMGPSLPWLTFGFYFLLLGFSSVVTAFEHYGRCEPIPANDTDLIQVALNVEFLEAEFMLNAAIGEGLDLIAPNLTLCGPPPIGARLANLDPLVRNIVTEFGYQEVGHIRAIFETVGGFPRPLINISPETFSNIVNKAFGFSLEPPFDPYANSLNYLLGLYIMPYVGLTGYVGTIPLLRYYETRLLVSGLLGVEAGQDAVVRGLLYERGDEYVHPYPITVYEFTERISILRNELGRCGIKDEGLIVPLFLGAENRTSSNVLSANASSLSYPRTPQEVLRIVYGTGNESIPDAFFPQGGNGRIARKFLHYQNGGNI